MPLFRYSLHFFRPMQVVHTYVGVLWIRKWMLQWNTFVEMLWLIFVEKWLNQIGVKLPLRKMSYKWFPKNFFTSHMIGLNWRENSFPEKFCKSFKCLMKTCAFHFALLTFFVCCGNFPVFWNGSILLIRHFSIKVFKWVNRDYCITAIRGVPPVRGGTEGAASRGATALAPYLMLSTVWCIFQNQLQSP